MYKFKAISFFPLLLISILCSCKKEPSKFCWQQVDNFGNSLGIICNKTEAEIQALLPNNCSYYKSGGETFCWLVDGVFLKDISTEAVNHYIRCFRGGAGTATKVACDYCWSWYHREKKTHKPTNSFLYSQVTREKFCGDTAKTLFQGRQIIKKDTPDSLIVIQFSSNGTTW